ncbi:aminomethyl-transferring glycine dehydrogenase subunit GcvPA [Caldisericum exile]|uniref:Probable glycine dehydrogenase [decarboxylating] subunit 1 n=1 Tax=Caldisericum exile (strain DSM 21853 / NBRC 104410 / AZM16c01) TaxID=511051 RepID=A0A7U6JFS8_CALEA|nr:aminomethyl-transferring glycine dehydrogenase subunit GcvPA [Caldisericum exile]BAL80555.1 probable glycine dehydrogenase [decarboxylating] subunit 1 [Caldisericum exile AZM16c01]
MRYISNTKEQLEEMLKEIGVSSFEDLIRDIPQDLRYKSNLKVKGPLSEEELISYIKSIEQENADFALLKPLVGAGAYKHFVPSVIKTILSREEFYTAYTPYQPELAQGTLQTMFEVQTHLSRLTGFDAIVPSIYDGASATAEAVLMTMRLSGKNRIVISKLLHPQYIETIKTYVAPHKTEIVEIPYNDNLTDINAVKDLMNNDTAVLVIQSPNFFGGIEDVEAFSKLAHEYGALSLQVVVESLSLALLKSPKDLGVDIVSGEAQSFGIDLNFGGPYNGYLATKMDFVRQLPGRIAGETVDRNGKRAFVMTLRSREQDIKREKATSNLCTSHNLNLYAIDAYLSLFGKEGLYDLATYNVKASHYLRSRLLQTGHFKGVEYPFFNEFVLETDLEENVMSERLKSINVIPPLKLSTYFEGLVNSYLFAVTEVFSKDDLDRIVEVLGR